MDVAIIIGIIGLVIAGFTLWWQVDQKQRQSQTRVETKWEQVELKNGRVLLAVRIRNLGERAEYVDDIEIDFANFEGRSPVHVTPTTREVPAQGSILQTFDVPATDTGHVGFILCNVTLANGSKSHAGPVARFFFAKDPRTPESLR